MGQSVRPSSVGLPRLIMIGAFRISMVWDMVTTFLGTLLILNGVHFISIGLSIVGTLTVGAFNFSTRAILETKRGGQREIYLIRAAWLLAIVFDFVTSLVCNATYVALGRFQLGGPDLIPLSLSFSQSVIILFITLLTTISPMLVGYLRVRAPGFLA